MYVTKSMLIVFSYVRRVNFGLTTHGNALDMRFLNKIQYHLFGRYQTTFF